MKKKFFFMGTAIFLMSLLTLSSSAKENINYNSKFKEAEALIAKGNPKSAAKLLDEIKSSAKKEGNSQYYIKSLLMYIATDSIVNEFTTEKRINALIEEGKSLSFPEKAVIDSITAKVIWNYYTMNRYRFAQRTQIAEFLPSDISTWSLQNLLNKVIELHYSALSEIDKLKQIERKEFSVLLSEGSDSKIRTSLYEIIAGNALDFFSQNEAGLPEPLYTFSIDSPDFFKMPEEFIKTELNSKDSSSMRYNAMKLFQLLEKHYISSNNREGLYDTVLKRVLYCQNEAVMDNKSELFEASLYQIIKNGAGSEAESQAGYEIAKIYYNKAMNKNILDEKAKIEFIKKAKDIAEKYSSSNSIGGANCSVLLEQMAQKSLSLSAENIVIPDENFKITLNYKNIDKLYFKIVEISNDKEAFSGDYNLFMKKLEEIKNRKGIAEWESSFSDSSNMLENQKIISAPKLPKGEYIILTGTNRGFSKIFGNGFAYFFFSVSDLSYIERSVENGKHELYVFDRKSGKPVKECSVTEYGIKYDYLKNQTQKLVIQTSDSQKTDENGHVVIHRNFNDTSISDFYLKLTKNNSVLYSDYVYSYYNNYYSRNEQQRTLILTDRALYRPGQTLFFKSIIYNSNGINAAVVPNYKTTVTFYDVNGSVISQKEITTNEFGSASGSFSIPEGVLNGTMRLSTSTGSCEINVEEYKRPKFEVKFEKPEQEFVLGEKVKVTGNVLSYSGFPVSDGTVKYMVKRKAVYEKWYFFYWFYPPVENEMIITHGNTVSDSNGKFSIEFDAIPDKTKPKSDSLYFTYEITADVTDTNGETRSGTLLVSAGYSSLKLSINSKEGYSKEEKALFSITAQNYNGVGRTPVFKVKISKLAENSSVDSTSAPKIEKSIFEKELQSSEAAGFSFSFADYPEGKYIIEASAADKAGRQVSSSSIFTVYSEKSSALPYKNINWFFMPSSYSEPGSKVKLFFGSSEEVWAVLEKESRGVISENRIIHLKNSKQLIEIPVTENDRGNFGLRLIFIKNGKIYNNEVIVTVPWSNKELEIKYGSFRDKIYPGTKEEYKITVSGKNGDKTMAETIAAMYDASLDYFKPHSWYSSIYSTYSAMKRWEFGRQFGSSNFTVINDWYLRKYLQYRKYTALNDFGVVDYYYGRRMYKNKMIIEEAAPAALLKSEVADYETSEKKDSAKGIAFDQSAENGENSKPKEMPIRKNLNETTFFYPELKSDENGNIVISFTSGEALTRWKLLLFSHTKDMKYGFSEKEVITSKEISVTPNIPRFLREGDSVVLYSKVTNSSAYMQKGTVKLSLLNAETMQNIDSLFSLENSSINFELEKNSSKSFSWKVKVPEELKNVVVRITCDTGKYSDGEESVIPVLSNRTLATDTLVLNVMAGKEKSYKFDSLLNKNGERKPYRLTFEWTSNPVWYAVQSLPYIAEYPYECSEQTFSRIYANSVSSFIIDKNRDIEKIYENWKSNPENLASNLEKNSELKQLLLQETPWVAEASNEKERIARIAILFDRNRIKSEMDKAVKKLIENQYENGGWPWFKGMAPNEYITRHIVAGFGKMKKMGINNSIELNSAIKKALSFIDYKMNEHYNNITDKKSYQISYSDIHYLYTRSFFIDTPLNKEYNKSLQFFIEKAKDGWLNTNKYSQAMCAVALFRNGDKTTPYLILKSLKEFSISSDELGMYWKQDGYGWYWYEAKIERQAAIIEAFAEITGSSKDVESMKVWLLKNKQTNSWDSTKSTVEAVYSLLMTGTPLLSEKESASVKLGNNSSEAVFGTPSDKMAGSGYQKQSIEGNNIKAEYGNISIKNSSKTVQWGALYYQYFDRLENLVQSSQGISIDKKLFIETNSDSGKLLLPVTDKRAIKVGDKVKVRIEIRCDRDMEYVHLKDQRGAGFEPLEQLSSYKFQDGLGYYEETKDSSQNFFFDYLPKGTYVFEYILTAFNEGEFSAGSASMQCMYAPEFSARSQGIRVKITQ